jgi:hypothetical protein
VAQMAKRKLTNRDGYEAVMQALRDKGVKAPQSHLAEMLGFRGRQAVNNWGGEIPPAHAYRVSLLTGVPMSVILPEVVEAVEKKLKEQK